MAQLPTLLDEGSAAAVLGVSVRTLQRWRHRGCGPVFVKLGRGRGRLCRYREADVLAFLDACARTSTRPPRAVEAPRREGQA